MDNQEDNALARTLFPPGSLTFILSIICSIIALVMALGLATVVFGQLVGGDSLPKLVVFMFVAGVFLIVHPNFRLTRGAKWPVTYMLVLLVSCLLLTVSTLAWASIQGPRNVFAGGCVAVVAAVLALLGYRSQALERFRAHFDERWSEHYRRREAIAAKK